MPFDFILDIGTGAAKDHTVLICALVVFALTLIHLLRKRMLITPPGVSVVVYCAASLFVLFPVLIYSNKRDYVLSNLCQAFILGIAITWAVAIFGFMKRPTAEVNYPTLHWRFVPQRAWIVLFALVCMLDPILAITRFGKVGLLHGNETMGAGGSHMDVFTFATVIGWECGAVASTMLQTDFLVSRLSWKEFLFGRRKWIDLVLVLFCLACNSTTGNRFIIVMNALSLASGLAIFNRLRTGLAMSGLVVLMVFFTVVGNFRIGRVEIKDKLSFETRLKFVDSALGWVSTYTEPIFPTLDTFLQNAPAPAWGGAWFNAIVPTVLRGVVLKKDRTLPIEEMYQIIPHYGMTFRTMYADLLFDFGPLASLFVGMALNLICVSVYNNSTQSARRLAIYLNTFQMFAFMPLLASFYTQLPFMSFAILLLVAVPAPKMRRRVRLVRSPRHAATRQTIQG